MAYKKGDRYQRTMFPEAIEDYVGGDDPVRVYDVFVDQIDMEKMGITYNEVQEGPSAYDPRAMLKLLLYGYSYGWRSSRKLERAVHHNISFIWLMSGLKPDHKTIANFRKNNKDALTNLLKQTARMCVALNLIEGNTLFVDGTKIRANASREATHSREYWESRLEQMDQRITKILDECEITDHQETGSLVQIDKDLQDKEALKERIQNLLKVMDRESMSSGNLTDPDCIMSKSRQGSHASYNAQIVVDDKEGLIVSSSVHAKGNDTNLLSEAIDKANQTLENPCLTACADAGYSSIADTKKLVDQGTVVIVPNQQQALHVQKEDPFSKSHFLYDEANNVYICPEGNVLNYSYYSKSKKMHIYRIRRQNVCNQCKHYGECTRNKIGRSISRLQNEKTNEMLISLYNSSKGQAVYRRRKTKVELPFGHIKRNLKGGTFLLRGLRGANAEMSLNATCFNIVRMISLLGGVGPAMKAIAT